MRTWIRNPFVLLILLSIPFLHGCEAQSNASIKGKIQMSLGWKPMIYLIQPQHFREIAADYLGLVIDSSVIHEDGSFSFKINSTIKDKTLFILAIQPEGSRYPNHLTDDDPAKANYMPVMYSPGETLEIITDVNSFQSSFSVKSASKENLNLLSLRNIRKNAFALYAQLASDMEDESQIIEKEKAFGDYLETMMSFADTTLFPDAAMIAIRWISPTNDYERIPEFIYNQCQKWSRLDPENKLVKELCSLAQKDKLPVMTGDLMPDMDLPLLNGGTKSLSALLGKKLTLVDVWASWCAPCRKESREELLPLWKKYHDQGFQIIGYSIDANEGPWKNAIEKDSAIWMQASHLMGDTSPLLEALRISTIPANYLVDANGKIVAKNLHGEEMNHFVEKYLR